MKKLLLQYGLLVIANVTIAILMTISFSIYILLQAPIMSAVPALLALPGILLQPWLLLVLIVPAPGLFWTSPFLVSLVTLLVYHQLNRISWFRQLWQRLPRLTMSQGLRAFGTVLVAALLVMFARFKDIPSLKTSPAVVLEIKLSLPDLHHQGRHYQLPSFFDQEGLWQVQLSQDQLDQVVDRLELQPISKTKLPSGFNGMPPYWWRPQHHNTTQYFATHATPFDPNNSGGFQAIAVWNPGDQYLYLWYKEVF